jgi:hypothetical protein
MELARTAGITHCSIDAYGNVKGCPIQPRELIEGNIRENRMCLYYLEMQGVKAHIKVR